VPALVHGTLPEQVADGTPLAISLNGRIGAVVPAVAEGDEVQFAGLIEDEMLFLDGANLLELFLVESPPGGGVVLQRLR
jgi:hypothetical protein